MKMRTFAAIGLLLIVRMPARGQAEDAPKFEVSTIKPAAPDARGTYVKFSPGGTLNINNMPLQELIMFAYRVQRFQISGAAGWMESQRFDLVAKPGRPVKDSDVTAMLQGLLTERFGLILHRETKELPMYAMLMAKAGGQPGSKLVASKEGSCTQVDRTKPMPPPEPGKAGNKYCGTMMMGRTGITASGVPLANLVSTLSRILGRPVVDKTGLEGTFDIELKYSPDDAQMFPSLPDAPKPVTAQDSADPPLLTALQEQLGLKLQAQKGPVEILVIDKASKPDPN